MQRSITLYRACLGSHIERSCIPLGISNTICASKFFAAGIAPPAYAVGASLFWGVPHRPSPADYDGLRSLSQRQVTVGCFAGSYIQACRSVSPGRRIACLCLCYARFLVPSSPAAPLRTALARRANVPSRSAGKGQRGTPHNTEAPTT